MVLVVSTLQREKTREENTKCHAVAMITTVLPHRTVSN